MKLVKVRYEVSYIVPEDQVDDAKGVIREDVDRMVKYDEVYDSTTVEDAPEGASLSDVSEMFQPAQLCALCQQTVQPVDTGGKGLWAGEVLICETHLTEKDASGKLTVWRCFCAGYTDYTLQIGARCWYCGYLREQIEQGWKFLETGLRVEAHFQPQQWVNNYAMNVDGDYIFDITHQVVLMGRGVSLKIQDDREETDSLWSNNPAFLEKPWTGPFAVTAELAIRDFWAAIDERELEK